MAVHSRSRILCAEKQGLRAQEKWWRFWPNVGAVICPVGWREASVGGLIGQASVVVSRVEARAVFQHRCL